MIGKWIIKYKENNIQVTNYSGVAKGGLES